LDYFLGEIRLFAFGQAPNDWIVCNGQSLPIQSNVALYSLLGTTYGGDGKTTFNVPDLRGRVPVQISQTIKQGFAGGTETVTLTTAQHSHPVKAYSTAGNSGALASAFPAQNTVPSATPAPPAASNLYGAASANNLVSISPASVSNSGSVANPTAHENRQPTIAMNYCIATVGLFPPRN
jgi:microcystin-dependent protein